MTTLLRIIGLVILFGSSVLLGYASGGAHSLELVACVVLGGGMALDLIRRILDRLEAGRA